MLVLASAWSTSLRKITAFIVVATVGWIFYMEHDNIKQQTSYQHPQLWPAHALPWNQTKHLNKSVSEISKAQSQKCTPKYSVNYVKIHKTGSGAFHNLLIRLAIRHNLTVVLLGPSRESLNKPPYEKFHDYNMFVEHRPYNREMQLKFMPPDTIFITQIRHPFTQAESLFYHFHAHRKYGVQNETNPFMAFLQTHQNLSVSVVQNYQSRYLGFNILSKNGSDNEIFDTFLKRIDSELYFVSILELMDESSVLLKRRMCWRIQDVLHMQTHVTRNKKQAESELMKRSERIHREISKMDYKLYDYFKNKLLQEIQQEPEFEDELKHYKIVNAQLIALCNRMCEDLDGVDSTNITGLRRLLKTGIDIPSTKFYSAFRVTYFDCLLLVSSETSNKKIMRIQQYPNACSNISQIAEYGLEEDDCDFSKHIYPGYHVKRLKPRLLRKDSCLANFY